MKVKELMARLASCDPELEVAAGNPIVAQDIKHQDSACFVIGVEQANFLKGESKHFGKRFVLIAICGVDEAWQADH